ncbi:MAG: hypothetical protein CR982_07950 [Candidatus Cloacimonadota bacterium]|nr:MAG: hypothetical protein CR982_07950 [Candidatus Cloacimonadota bacterium]PIE77611.1 MAG: hypothetical protein CSA15_11850 [Candidatus Delongbacteria bacterium]
MRIVYYLLLVLSLVVCNNCTKKKARTIEDKEGVKSIRNVRPDSSIAVKLDSIFTIVLDSDIDEDFLNFYPALYTLDKNSNIFMSNGEKIYKVNNRGKLLTKFGGKGQGPGEFSSFVSHIFVVDNYLYAYELSNSTIHKFDTSGRFVKSFPTDYPLYQILPLKDKTFLALNYSYDNKNKIKSTTILKLDLSLRKSKEIYKFDRKLSKDGFPYDNGMNIHLGDNLYLVYKDRYKYHYDIFSLETPSHDSIKKKQSVSKSVYRDDYSDKKMKDIKSEYRKHFPEFKNTFRERLYLWNKKLSLDIPIVNSFLDNKDYLWIQTTSRDSLEYKFDIFKDGLFRNTYTYTAKENERVYFYFTGDILLKFSFNIKSGETFLVANKILYHFMVDNHS